MAADIVDFWHLSQSTVEGPSLQNIGFGIWYFWGDSGVPRGCFLEGLGGPDVLIIRAGGVLDHAMPCVSNVLAAHTYSSVSESLSATNPFNRRIGASVIMNCVESIFLFSSAFHGGCIQEMGEQPYEHNWIWNLQTQPKNLRLSEGPQNHETS